MTNKLYSAILAGTAVLAVTLGASSANAATATGTAKANIVQALTITATSGSSLNFGAIVPGTSASTVIVSNAGARTCGTGLVCTGSTSAQTFDVTGTAGMVVVVTPPSGSVVLASGTNTMNVALTHNASGAGNTFTLGAGGTFQLAFGGTLSVAASQAAGAYSKTFDVSVDYQ